MTKMMCDKVGCKRLCVCACVSVMVCSKHVCVCGRWCMTKLPATKLCVRKMVCLSACVCVCETVVFDKDVCDKVV